MELPRRIAYANIAGLVFGLLGLVVSVVGQWDFISANFDRLFQRYVQPHVESRPAVIELQPFRSGDMGGGHNVDEVCGPLQRAYQAEHPDYNIQVQTHEESSKDFVGHVTYRYTCYYQGALKN